MRKMSDEIKENLEDKEQIYWVGVFFVFLIVINFLIVHSFADQCSTDDVICTEGLNQWYVFIFRFQTLIGGLLAVGAAYITVRQMRLNERENERRHREGMNISDKERQTGAEALRKYSRSKLSHNFYIFALEVKVMKLNLDAYEGGDILNLAKVDGAESTFDFSKITDAKSTLQTIRTELNMPIWQNNIGSLTAAGRSYFQKIATGCDQILEYIEGIQVYFDEDREEQISDEYLEWVIVEQCDALHGEMSNFMDELKVKAVES